MGKIVVNLKHKIWYTRNASHKNYTSKHNPIKPRLINIITAVQQVSSSGEMHRCCPHRLPTNNRTKKGIGQRSRARALISAHQHTPGWGSANLRWLRTQQMQIALGRGHLAHEGTKSECPPGPVDRKFSTHTIVC